MQTSLEVARHPGMVWWGWGMAGSFFTLGQSQPSNGLLFKTPAGRALEGGSQGAEVGHLFLLAALVIGRELGLLVTLAV